MAPKLLGAPPTHPAHAVTKGYVDTAVNTTPEVLVWDEEDGWPERTGTNRPAIYVGGTDPDDAPDGDELRAGDLWVPFGDDLFPSLHLFPSTTLFPK